MSVEPFRFYTSLKLPEFVGRRAGTVDELLDGIRAVDGSSIFHHTFHFLYEHQYAPSQPPSDFAYWVGVILLDHGLAERLAAINTVEFDSVHDLRGRLIEVVEDHRKTHRCQTRAPDGMDFFFMRSNSIVIRTPYEARDLMSFVAGLSKVSIGSLYHHMFESKLARERGGNDFSEWLRRSYPRLEGAAQRIERLDPYLLSLEEIRRRIMDIVRSEGEPREARA